MPYLPDSEGSTLTTNSPEPKKLVLCFDGTGNEFSGSNADTNVVKLLSKLDRNHPDQFHYYQTGIGTYDVNDTSINKTWFGQVKSNVSQTLDQGFGTTFDAHVLAGYRFLMRYYEPNAKIYVFGFSRGAFTAKFLARMVNTVGLLCKGNEEMVPFAYRLYQRYLAGDIHDRMDAQQKQDVDPAPSAFAANSSAAESDPLLQAENNPITVERSEETEVALNEITAFSQTFCRKETCNHHGKSKEENIKVYFLGIWDCVNSVAVLEQKAPIPVPVTGTARFVRHAVAVDERRVKFKPALLAQDIRGTADEVEDIKEIWFPGCHGDVGGGWPSVADNPLDNKQDMTLWQRIKNFWRSRKPEGPSKDINHDRLQMSDIPLSWMIRELELVGQQEPSSAVKWNENVDKFKKRFQQYKIYALESIYHDSLAFGYGTGFFKVLLWWFMEYLPLITRWELVENKWVNVRFPLNGGASRDIPRDAVLHDSVIWRLRNDPTYVPSNNHGDNLPTCLHAKGCKPDDLFKKEVGIEAESDPNHQTYVFSGSA
ncbi:hypothetical protein PT974_12576 [Cladobotryum mycophilum]|uniref:T6SS Phospholipase effector Tle1-like catalytic domain-containing protein n=1 Tax=Cladobotryum mycophilum TaxID=491253 RepID=A0ABR0S8C1_9HYPO